MTYNDAMKSLHEAFAPLVDEGTIRSYHITPKFHLLMDGGNAVNSFLLDVWFVLPIEDHYEPEDNQRLQITISPTRDAAKIISIAIKSICLSQKF